MSLEWYARLLKMACWIHQHAYVENWEGGEGRVRGGARRSGAAPVDARRFARDAP